MGAEIRGAILELGVHLWVARYAGKRSAVMHGQWSYAAIEVVLWVCAWLPYRGGKADHGEARGPDFRAQTPLNGGHKTSPKGGTSGGGERGGRGGSERRRCD